ncbi:MAG TPA: TrkA C-terminal domain-containing protein, partial [Acidimicrobiia bacterium]|nr:TrkA C-terminal domain-containing protein [Acidimicrobiia bacterium]
RAICILAGRSPQEAEGLSGVLQIISAIERVGNAAVDVSRIVSRRLGIPAPLVADLARAEEVSHRVRVREDSPMAHRTLRDLELPTEAGMRVVAIRRAKDWITDPGGDDTTFPNDVLILQGAAAGISVVRVLAGAPEWRPPSVEEDPAITDLDRAVDVLVEMKNVSEVAVGLAYSALMFRDTGLALEVVHLEDRLDEMKERLEVWVLRAGAETVDPGQLRGLLHLGQAAEEIGDAAQQMVWLVEHDEELHPVVAAALGESDEVIVSMPVADASAAVGRSLRDLKIETETGFYLLAIRRGGGYIYRPAPGVVLQPGDELIASGPDEGRDRLGDLCGFRVRTVEDTGEIELVPVAGGERH